LLLATDVADYLVGKGMPFRRAHEVVGRARTKTDREQRDFETLSLAEWRAAASCASGRPRAHHAGESVQAKRTPPVTAPDAVGGPFGGRPEWLDGLGESAKMNCLSHFIPCPAVSSGALITASSFGLVTFWTIIVRRERRVTNHVIVAMIAEDVEAGALARVRRTTTSSTRGPRQRARSKPGGSLAQVLAPDQKVGHARSAAVTQSTPASDHGRPTKSRSNRRAPPPRTADAK